MKDWDKLTEEEQNIYLKHQSPHFCSDIERAKAYYQYEQLIVRLNTWGISEDDLKRIHSPNMYAIIRRAIVDKGKLPMWVLTLDEVTRRIFFIQELDNS